MVEPINLNKARKARDKASQRAEAAANRVSFGRTGTQKATDRLNGEAAARRLDGAKRETDEES